MKKQPLAVLALAALLGLASCGETLSSSSSPSTSGSSSLSSSVEEGSSSSEESSIPSSDPASDSTTSDPSSEEGTKIPAAMIGVYEGNDGHRYLKLTVGEDSLDLNGTIGTIVSDFAEYEGTIRGRVAFGDTTYYVDYVDDGTDHYIALTSGSTVATLYPEGTVEEPLPPLPSTFVGTWKGTDLETSLAYTLVVDGEGIPTLNGTRGYVQFVSESGAEASILFGEELYELTLSSSGILLEKADHSVSAVLVREEIEEPDEPAVLVPEAAWIGVWTDGTHTIEITAEGLWSVDGTFASNVEKSGEYYSVRIGKLYQSTRYQLSLVEEGGETIMLAETLSSKWTLHKEGAETPELELPSSWIGTWTGSFMGTDVTLTIAEDMTITILGTVAEGATYDEATGTLSITFMGMPATATLEWNQGIYEIHVAVMGSELVLRKDGEAPVTLPAGWVGEWSGTIMGMSIALTVADDMTITMGGEALTGWTYDAAADELHIDYSGMAIVAALVEEEGVSKIAIKMAGTTLGYLEKAAVETPSIPLPAEWAGTWVGVDTNAEDGATYTVVITEEGTITINGVEATVTAEDYGWYDLLLNGKKYTIWKNGEQLQLYSTGTDAITVNMTKQEAEEPEPEPTVEIPEGMIGTWSATELDKTYELVVTADSIALNGVVGTGLTAFEEDSYGDLVAHIYFDGVEHSIAYSATPGFTPSVILDNLETSSSYDYPILKKVEVEEPDPEPAVEIPEGMIGTWSATELGKTYELIVTADTITLNGVEGTGLTAFEEDSYGDLVAHIYFDGVEHSIAYSAGSGFTPSVILDNLETSSLYDYPYLKKVETEEPGTEPEEPVLDLPDGMIGTWTAEDMVKTYELIVTAESITLNGVEGTGLTAFEEDIYGDLVAHIYFDGVEHSIAYSTSLGSTATIILDNLETSSLYDYPYLKKVEVEEPQPEEPDEPAIAIPEGYDGTYEGGSGDQTFTLVVEGDTITLNGVEGTITELRDAGYAWTGKVDFGGTVYGIEFSENFDNEPIISINCSDPYLYWTTLDKVADTTEPEPEPEEPSTGEGEVAYAAWFGTYEMTQSGKTYTMIISADGITLNGVAGTAVEEFAANTYGGFLGKYAFDGIEYDIELYHSTLGEGSYSIYLTCKDNANYMISALMTKVS